MIKVIKESFLNKATPYMLRNDGILLECGDMHPYIKYYQGNSNQKEILILLNHERGNALEWFYTNSNEYIKDLIDRFISAVLSSPDYDLDSDTVDYLNQRFKVIDLPNASKFDIESEFELLNEETNQMFCRVRTSDMRYGGSSGDIYFRISSADYNWFDLIWKVVNDNKSFIETVSICTDPQSRETLKWYNHLGKIIKFLPTEEFLCLSGNPVIETLNTTINKLSQGKTLQEATQFTHPYHIVRYFSSEIEDYIDKNFR